MKRSLDGHRLMDGLKHAANLISELRTSLLTPKSYYSLYMAVFDYLRHLSAYVSDAVSSGKRSLAELYELVQYSGNIVPRLYLLITVGGVYLQNAPEATTEVIRDLVEMCRGVQHPTRGLFLRTYLSEVTKDALARVDSVHDTVEFVLANFVEMNKLWVRLHFQGAVRDRSKREAERSELRLLVGKNLARLAQLDDQVTLSIYQESVLPRVLDQISVCNDKLAQQYLTECLIQVFPDEYHLQTLDSVLATVVGLIPTVDVTAILVTLVDRLVSFAEHSRASIPSDVDVFGTFYEALEKLVEKRSGMSAAEVITVCAQIVRLSAAFYKSRITNINQTLEFAAEYLKRLEMEPGACSTLNQLLEVPIEAYDATAVLRLPAFADVLAFARPAEQRRIVCEFASNAIKASTIFSTKEQVVALLTLCAPIIQPGADQAEAEAKRAAAAAAKTPDDEDDEFDEEKRDFVRSQNLLGQMVHLVVADEPGVQFELFAAMRRAFAAGGASRLKFTMPPLVLRACSMAASLRKQNLPAEAWNAAGRSLFKFVGETVAAVAKTDTDTGLALRLNLAASLEADRCGFESAAYQFFARALAQYEELAGSADQAAAILVAVAALQSTRGLSQESYDTLLQKVAQYSARLLKKEDQALAVAAVSHLFWRDLPTDEERASASQGGPAVGESAGYRDGKRVLECLQRSLKIADGVMDAAITVDLFVKILQKYCYYFEQEDAEGVVTGKHISGLCSLISTNISQQGDSVDKDVVARYQRTLAHIRGGERYSGIDI
jgi:vacuolar protein sorting-associated protein 35